MKNVQLNRPITMCIAQFNLYLVVLVVAILPITRPAIASHNLARFNSGINPGIPGLSKLNPEIPGLAKRSGIAFPKSNGPSYKNTVTSTLAVDGWAVTFGTARKGLGGAAARPGPSSLYRM